MIHRLSALLIGITLAGVLPTLACGLPVASSTLDTYRTCILAGVSSASTAMAEASIDEQYPSSNAGSATTMDVQSKKSRNRRSYVRFDLTLCSPAIPASATIVDAQLHLFVTSLAANCRTIDLFRVTASWAEDTLSWNNQPFGTAIGNPPTSQRSSSADVGLTGSCANTTSGYVVWAATADVQAFVAGAATNHGWMLRDDVEGSGATRTNTFATAEGNNADRAPRLLITYRP